MFLMPLLRKYKNNGRFMDGTFCAFAGLYSLDYPRFVSQTYQLCKTDSNSRSKVCVKYAGPMELWNDALVTTCEGQSRRRFSPLRLSANTEMLRTACFLCVIGHRELL